MTQRAAVKEKWVEIKCAFCGGTGRDSFKILSPLSNCGTCGGTGRIRVKETHVACRACDGTGVQPFSRFACLGCGGKGVQSIQGRVDTCPVCEGSGADGLHLYCLRCHGKGVVPAVMAVGREA